MRRAVALLIAFLALGVPGGLARAQDIDFALPSSPAFTFLGATPDKIDQPDSTRELGAHLLSVVDDNGTLKAGLALEFQPSYLFGIGITLSDYQNSRWLYAFDNLQVSLATLHGGDAISKDVDAALGVQVIVYDAGDPLLDGGYGATIDKALRECAPAEPVPDGAVTTNIGCMVDHTKEFREKWEKEHWNATRLGYGVAIGLHAPGADLGESEFLGWGFWGTGSLQLGKYFQGLAKISFDDRHLGATVRSGTGAARFVGGTNKLHALIEASATYAFDAPDGADTSQGTWSLGLEWQISKGFWLTVDGGKAVGAGDEEPPLLVLAGFGLGVSDAAKLLTH